MTKNINFIIVIFLSFVNLYELNDLFNENLIISNLNSAISFHFDFSVTTDNLKSNDYHLFPKVITDVIRKHSLNEMHISMSRGFWNSEKWGIQPEYAPSQAAEIYAWFLPTEKNVEEKWKSLTYSLSAMFCTSLHQLSIKNEYIKPRWSYRPVGLINPSTLKNDSFIRRGILSEEPLCTENLTPWLKLLPCKSWGGLSQLLQSKRAFLTHYLALSLSVSKICTTPDCHAVSLKLHQTVTLVLDRVIMGNFYNTWSLRELLAKKSQFELCPLATTSKIWSHNLNVTMKPNSIVNWSLVPEFGNEKVYLYDISQLKNNERAKTISLDIGGYWPEYSKKEQEETSLSLPILVTKFATGTGNIYGGIKSIIRNQHKHFNITVVYLDSLSWYFKMMIHSLKISTNKENIDLDPTRIHYVPSIKRTKPTHLEIILNLPPQSETVVEYRFKKELQNWNEYPPDANHEFSVTPSAITFIHPDRDDPNNISYGYYRSINYLIDKKINIPNKNTVVRIYSALVLVPMPSPDFSMPFNALCFGCSALVLLLGGLHSVTTYGVILVHPNEQGFLKKLISRLGILK